jgi:flavin-dependent dehydrogenase
MAGAYDVAILGGGKAGLLLARQLRREVPNARVLLLERDRERSFKVGESTVDVAGSYLTRRLGLSSYLYQHQLPKNGLRFFFDRADTSAELHEQSEIGSTGLSPFAAFQIDRRRFEEDLLAMNAADGVEVRVGVRAARVDLGEGGHAIALEEEGRPAGTVQARWVVDATGRASLLARALRLRTEAPLANAAAWGRVRGLRDIDDVGPPAFHARVRHTARMLSTNHFCHPGYWIWLIPLGQGITSVGVVMQKERLTPAMRTMEGLRAFLAAHRGVGSLLAPAEWLDVMSFGQLAYGTTRFVDARARWALVGEAAAFTDPLYSPGADFVALENDWVTDLVRRDLAGEEGDALARRAALYEQALLVRLASTSLLYEGLYDTLGSFDLFATKWDVDLACYVALWLEPYLLDTHLDLGAVEREVASRDVVLGVLRTWRATLLAAEHTLRREGRYHENNLGRAVLDPTLRFLTPDFGSMASHRRALPRVRDALQAAYDALATRLGRAPTAAPIPFSTFALGRSLL